MSNLQFCKYKLLKSTYYISGHGLITITAKSKFGTNGLWRRAFYVRRSLKGLRKPFERIFQRKWNVIWTLFWTFFEMDKSCLPVAELALSGKKHSHCGQSTYCIWFLQWQFPWVLPGMGLFHQHFLQNSFEHVAASDMIFIDILRATSELFSIWMHWTAQRQLERLFIHVHTCGSQSKLLQRSGAGRIISMLWISMTNCVMCSCARYMFE